MWFSDYRIVDKSGKDNSRPFASAEKIKIVPNGSTSKAQFRMVPHTATIEPSDYSSDTDKRAFVRDNAEYAKKKTRSHWLWDQDWILTAY